MLRSILHRIIAETRKRRQETSRSDRIQLYAHIDRQPDVVEPASAVAALVAAPKPARVLAVTAHPSHREHLLSMQLEHIRLCSPHRCKRLRELGILTAGDLASISPERLAREFRAPRRAVRVLREYRRAVRFAASVPGMMPRDAMLLIGIHRRSVQGLARETPGLLYRDLERYAESTQGRLQLRGRRIPSTKRLRRWINECKSLSAEKTLHARAA